MVTELVRVARRHIVLSISLKSWQVRRQGLREDWRGGLTLVRKEGTRRARPSAPRRLPRATARPQNDGRHTLLRPRAWWEAKFAAAGAVVNQPLLWAMQNKEIRWGRSAPLAVALE